MKLYSMALTTTGVRPDVADGVEDGVVEAGLLLGLVEALLVGLEVDEVERIGGAEAAIDELIAGLEQQIDAGTRADFEVVLALGADVQVGFEVGLPDGLAAAGALDPEALSAYTFFLVVVRGFELAVFALKPGHRLLAIV